MRYIGKRDKFAFIMENSLEKISLLYVFNIEHK